jgi:hypothetical protein
VLKKEIEEALFLVVMVLASAHLERGGREVEMVNLLGKGEKGKGRRVESLECRSRVG